MAHRQRLRGRKGAPGGGHRMSKAQSHKQTFFFFFFKGIASSWRLLAMGDGEGHQESKVSQGTGPAHAGPGRFWKAKLRHLHPI